MCSRILKIRWPKVRVVSNTASPYLKPRSRNGTRASGSGTKRPLKYAMRARAVVMMWPSGSTPGRWTARAPPCCPFPGPERDHLTYSPRMGLTRPVVAGVSVSLSGPLSRQGKDADEGLRLWVDPAVSAGGPPLRLVALDDASSASRARENAARLLTAERVDLLLGPYGSGSTLAVARVAAAHRKILWNHGGASDAVTEAGSAFVVSVL